MTPILLAAAYFLTKGGKALNTAKNLSFSPTGIKFDKQKKALKVIVQASNPTNTSLTVDAVNLTVKADGSQIGTIQSYEKFTIPANGSKDLSFAVKFSVGGLAMFVLKFVTSRTVEAVELIGNIKYKGISLPIDKKIPVNFTAPAKKPKTQTPPPKTGGNG